MNKLIFSLQHNPTTITRLKITIQWLNILLLLVVLVCGAKITADWIAPPKATSQVLPTSEKEKEIAKPKIKTFESYQSFWRMNINPKSKPAKPVVVLPKKTIPKKTLRKKIEVPFQWVGVVLREDPGKSFAIIENKNTRKQTMVRSQDVLAGTNFIVEKIEKYSITLRSGNEEAQILHPQKNSLPQEAPSSTKVSLKENQRKVIIAKSFQIGSQQFVEGDQVLRYNSIPIFSIAQLKKYLRTEKHLKIDILRKGRVITWMITPKTTIVIE